MTKEETLRRFKAAKQTKYLCLVKSHHSSHNNANSQKNQETILFSIILIKTKQNEKENLYFNDALTVCMQWGKCDNHGKMGLAKQHPFWYSEY